MVQTLQTYRARVERGMIVPLGNPVLPEGSNLIVTVLEENPDDVSRRQREAMARFREANRASGPLPPEFDEIMKERVNITREISL